MPFFPTDLPSFLALIKANGDIAYSLMFAWASSHSLLLALFGGYAAHSGALNFPALIVVCWAGTLAGDVLRFWIGRLWGLRLLKRWPRIDGAVRKAAALAERHAILMILLHRYPHGIRGIAGFAYGMSKMSWWLFLAVNFVAAGIWAVSAVSIGYAFGEVSEKVMSDASSSLGGVTLVVFLGLSWWLSRKFDAVATAALQKPAQQLDAAPGSDAARRERRLRNKAVKLK